MNTLANEKLSRNRLGKVSLWAGGLIVALQCSMTPCRAQTSSPPPQMKHPLIPSHGENLLGVIYLTAGDGSHPTALLFHGLPGFEQNLDIAQALRSAGWNVLAYHYRGTWGVKGDFSFKHCLEDGEAEVNFVFDKQNAALYHIDTHHVVVIGHSLGGFVAAATAAHEPRLGAVVMLSPWNIGAKRPDEAEEASALARGENMAPLAGTDATQLAHEEFSRQAELDMVRFAPSIAAKPILMTTADDGSSQFVEPFAEALHAAGSKDAKVLAFHTDHAYSGKRHELADAIIKFLQQKTDRSQEAGIRTLSPESRKLHNVISQ